MARTTAAVETPGWRANSITRILNSAGAAASYALQGFAGLLMSATVGYQREPVSTPHSAHDCGPSLLGNF